MKKEYQQAKGMGLKPVLIHLSEYFEIVDKQKSHYTNESIQGGNYSLIGAAKTNNGIVGYLNTYDYENCFTIVKDGDGAYGIIFYHPYKFSKVPTVYVINLKQEIKNIDLNCKLISLQLHTIFDHENKINKEIFDKLNVYIHI